MRARVVGVGSGEACGSATVAGIHEAVDVLVTEMDTTFVAALGVIVVVTVVVRASLCGVSTAEN